MIPLAAPTAVPQVIDYLYTTCAQSPAIGLATPAVAVYDGPNPTADALVNQRLLWIGYDPQNQGMEAATSTRDWPFLDHARTSEEDGELTCAAEFWSGSTVMKPARDGCAAIVEAVATLLTGDPRTGGPGDTSMGDLVLWSRVSATAWSLSQGTGEAGATAVCVFKIMYKTRMAP